MTVVFLNDSQMRVYNRTYRRKDTTTDVLSFPVNDDLDDQGHYLGDVLISMEQAGKQAVERSRAMEEEVRILMLHGVLHLLGYDHETDRGQMNRLEKKLRVDLGLADGHK
jgi:probable rRNA maturation factor